MFRLLLALLLVLPAGAFAQAPAPKPEPIPIPNPVPVPVLVPVPIPAPAPGPGKLELPAPRTVAAGSGFIKIKTSLPGVDTAWDVFGVFSDPALTVQVDVNGDTLYLGIPAVGGAIRITATALVGGRLQQAVTFVTINDPVALAPGAQDPPVANPNPTPAGPGGLSITVIGMSESAPLRQAIEKAGHSLWVYPAGDPRLAARPDLLAEQKTLGTPCIVVTDAKGDVKLAQKLTAATDAAIVETLNKLAKGK